MSTTGTLQLFDESVNLTNGGPANATITMSHYIYNLSFKYVPNFGLAAAMSYIILILAQRFVIGKSMVDQVVQIDKQILPVIDFLVAAICCKGNTAGMMVSVP